jgi:hypothetical protein
MKIPKSMTNNPLSQRDTLEQRMEKINRNLHWTFPTAAFTSLGLATYDLFSGLFSIKPEDLNQYMVLHGPRFVKGFLLGIGLVFAGSYLRKINESHHKKLIKAIPHEDALLSTVYADVGTFDEKIIPYISPVLTGEAAWKKMLWEMSKNQIKTIGRPRKRLELLLEFEKRPEKYDFIAFELYRCYSNLKMDDHAARYFIETIKRTLDFPVMANKHLMSFNRERIALTPFHQKNPRYLEFSFLLDILQREYSDALEILQLYGNQKLDTTELLNRRLMMQLGSSLVAPYISEKTEAWKQTIDKGWSQILNNVLSSKGTEFSSVDNAHVSLMKPNAYFGNFITFKESDERDSLRAEFEASKRLDQLIQKDARFKVAKPIAIISNEGKHYYISMYEDGSLLEDLDDSKALEAFGNTATYLGIIHKSMRTATGVRDMQTLLSERLSEYSDAQAANAILENWHILWKSCSGPLVFDKDAHSRNWIISDRGSITAIDNVDKGLVPQTFDLAKLLERSAYFFRHPAEKQEIIDEYLSSYGLVDYPSFVQSYRDSVPLMAINYLIQRPATPVWNIFRENAVKQINLSLSSPLTVQSHSERLQYETIRRVLEQQKVF